jgi:NADH-quinone oxidoreductase subunit L
MTHTSELIWLIPGAPFIGFIINGAISFFKGEEDAHHGHSSIFRKISTYISPAAVLVSFLVAVTIFLKMLGHEETDRTYVQHLYSWLKTGYLDADIGFKLDQLSILFVLIITGVGFLIHIYSTGYMDHDPSLPRFFAYLNLFTFSMLLLVMGDNVLLMFVGWEGVGLCSYLLIGFWHKNREYAAAGMKAFIVNRVGDFAFLVGFFMLFWGMLNYGSIPSVTFEALKEAAEKMPEWYITIIAVLFFIGATGKSAQIPLYVWLPDAMAGPTPVSALIHAATMVTAGIYMIARMSVLFMASPLTLTVVSIVAGLTAFFAATIGITQHDIKKVLAYSTVSQLGYMFLGMGAGAFSAGIFHVMTHAFFKALLFLGAGSVILATHHEQDIRQMGGLRKKIPITFFTFLIGTIAIAGIPGFSGFFSKDEILWQTYSTPNHYIPELPHILWGLAALTAGITSFYMFRLLFLTFFGKYRGTEESYSHIHESPLNITIPLMVLAVLSVFGGYLGVPASLGGSNHLHHWLEPVLTMKEHVELTHEMHVMEYTLMGVSIAIAISGLSLAWVFYLVKPSIPGIIAGKISGLHKLVFNKYYIDELYEATFIAFVMKLRLWLNSFDQKVIDALVNFTAVVLKFISRIHGWFDRAVVDRSVNFVAEFTQYWSDIARSVQTGILNKYLYYIVGSFVMVFVILMIGGISKN